MTAERWTLQRIGTDLALHIARETEYGKKVLDLYQLVVTGDGKDPSLSETVRNHSSWIATANRLILIMATAVLGQMILFGCALIYGLITLLSSHGLPIGP